MKYFDVHIHFPSADERGLASLIKHVEDEPGMIGGNLILNTPEEVEFAYRHIQSLPPSLNIVPYYEALENLPPEFTRSGWFKIHPRIHRIDQDRVRGLCEQIVGAATRPRGLMVHCYPWGPELEFNSSLPLVIALAQALPEVPILVAHGGGYESWHFRAHTGMLKNVCYDFSVTMSYYQGSDLLRPFQRYLRYSSSRVVFGSDWPTAGPHEQLEECARLAGEIGITHHEMEQIFLSNSKRLWPDMFTNSSRGK